MKLIFKKYVYIFHLGNQSSLIGHKATCQPSCPLSLSLWKPPIFSIRTLSWWNFFHLFVRVLSHQQYHDSSGQKGSLQKADHVCQPMLKRNEERTASQPLAGKPFKLAQKHYPEYRQWLLGEIDTEVGLLWFYWLAIPTSIYFKGSSQR